MIILIIISTCALIVIMISPFIKIKQLEQINNKKDLIISFNEKMDLLANLAQQIDGCMPLYTGFKNLLKSYCEKNRQLQCNPDLLPYDDLHALAYKIDDILTECTNLQPK